ncbi:antirestriction protein (plasmid) [Dyella sp. BiH032]|uniref:antirestriction protein n=1 Tax=Dyella sp. BiH032 TaxID=3075430 RepID=UPI002892E3A2|nr:antirestriction protein [Dyella sp. BiH032]WNL48535.1 antirestriction protein [Dyella sp. BiH032]
MHNQAAAQFDSITATLVEGEKKRLEMLPKYFGMRYMLRAEGLVYGWMGKLCPNYRGAYWNYFELSNGGFFMAPSGIDTYDLVCQGAQCTVHVGGTAAGIIATLYMLNQLANTTRQDSFCQLYRYLLEYAREHAEWKQIRTAID